MQEFNCFCTILSTPILETWQEKANLISNQDEYFRKNLPSSYGSVSVEPPPSSAGGEDGQYSSVEQSIFSGEVRKCSMGFQEMSRNLRALGNGSRDAIQCCHICKMT